MLKRTLIDLLTFSNVGEERDLICRTCSASFYILLCLLLILISQLIVT